MTRASRPTSSVDPGLGINPTPGEIKSAIKDIAGVRITCSFITDAYRVLDSLTAQEDIRVVAVNDYIATPKLNGYRSLHAIIEIPVFLSTGPVDVSVEVQVRTIAMDFWASLEHKIYYKYEGAVPPELLARLTETARLSEQLDHQMEDLYAQVHHAAVDEDIAEADLRVDEQMLLRLWDNARTEALRGHPHAD